MNSIKRKFHTLFVLFLSVVAGAMESLDQTGMQARKAATHLRLAHGDGFIVSISRITGGAVNFVKSAGKVFDFALGSVLLNKKQIAFGICLIAIGILFLSGHAPAAGILIAGETAATGAAQGAVETLTEADLTKMIDGVVKGTVGTEVKTALDALRKEIAASTTKGFIPNMEGDFVNGGYGKTFAGSQFDASVFGRLKNIDRYGREEKTVAQDFGMAFMTQGGFWRKLSPAMEMFGKMIKVRANRSNFDYDGFVKLCKSQIDSLSSLGFKATADMGEGSVGFDIPIEFPAIIIEAVVQSSPLLSKVWRFPMNEATASFPKLMQDDEDYFGGVITQWQGTATVSEGVTMTETQPATAKNIFTAKKVTHLLILTDELIQDAPINILNYVTGLLVRKYEYDLERVIIAGNGTTQPLGITNDKGVCQNAVSRITGGTVTVDDLINVDGALNEIFRNSMMLTRKATLSTVRRQRNQETGIPAVFESWQSLMATNVRTGNILGLDYWLTRNVPIMGQRGDVITGDFSMYGLGMRLNQRIDISDAPRFLQNETVVRFISRLDGMPMTDFAFKMLEGKKS